MSTPISPGFLIEIVQGTRPSIQFQWRDRGGAALDVTGMTIKCAAKRKLSDTDANKLFDLTASIDAGTTGLFTVAFTAVETPQPGDYPATLRRWNSGDATTGRPRDAYDGTIRVTQAVIRSEV